jgi:DNA segregation ATPase FtsK/SpoIIIE, S-DNA-T family
MALRDILDRQANSIEYVLHTHGIKGHVDGGRLSPRLAHFHIVLPPGVRPTQLSPLVLEIADALGVSSCRLAPGSDTGEVYLEVPRPDPIPVRLLPLVQRVADVVPPTTATLGIDTSHEGTPLLLRLNAADVDPVLVSGSRGAGKSKLLRSLALSLALHNSPERLRLLLLDCSGEGVAFPGMDHLPHLACPIAIDPVNSLVSLRWALRTLARRNAASQDLDSGELFFEEEGESPVANPGRDEEPVLVIIVDGADMLLNTLNRRANAEAADALNRLVAAGNRYGIHLVMSSERPDIDLNVEWGARIAGMAPTMEMARLATGMKGSGAQGLLGAGDFLISLNAELIRFQAAAVSTAEVARAVDLINSWLDSPRLEEVMGQPAEAGDDQDTPFPTPMRRERTVEEPVPMRRSWAGE